MSKRRINKIQSGRNRAESKMANFVKFLNGRSAWTPKNLPNIASLRFASRNATANYSKYEKDPGPKFLHRNNRDLMKTLTRLDIERVFQSRPTPFNKFSYHFLTRAEVRAKLDGSLRSARRMLHMPPVVKEQEDKIDVLSRDPALQGLETSKLIIADITFNIKDADRTILVRQPDGTLETAPAEIRRRINQTYFPLEGRKVIVPKMFEGEHLQRCLDEGNYEFVLNRACIQFEPYDRDYHRVTAITYQHISDHCAFDVLRSTRHFGPLAFFLAWHQNINNLVIDCIRRDYLRNAVEAICLSFNLNDISYDTSVPRQLKEFPERNDEYYYRKLIESNDDDFSGEEKIRFDIEKTVGKTADDIKIDNICLTFIDKYANEHASQNMDLKSTLSTFREEMNEKQKLLEGLHKAHGVSV